jgi:DNA-binding XRE family transcriptional regulator
MTGPDDWVILVCPPGAETAPISHGDRAELAAWRNQLGWSLDEAARQLGISRRAYVYLEAGLTSRGRKMPFIPELARRHGSPILRAG